MKSVYLKDIFREIKKSFSRFMSILLLVALGSGFFVGLKAATPSFKKQASDYFADNYLMDFKVISPLGFTDSDLEAVKTIPEIDEAQLIYSIDATVSNTSNGHVFTIYSMIEDNNINRVSLEAGNMPSSKEECVVDSSSEYSIGDILTFDEYAGDTDLSTVLSTQSFEVVGLVDMPNYFAVDYGRTSLGNGSIDGFVILHEDAFILPEYTTMLITLKCHKDNVDIFDESYSDIVDSVKNELENIGEEQFQISLNNRLDALAEARAKLEESLSEMGLTYEAIEMLDPADNDLKELIAAINEIEEGESSLNAIEHKNWYIFNRDEIIPYYTSVSENADTIDGMSAIFPVVFLLVVALVCVTTMSRMVEEHRIYIGTYKALGYSTKSIMWKYLLYSGLASILGGILGVIIFVPIIPRVVIGMYKILYNFPVFSLVIPWNMVLIAVLVAIISTVFITWITCRKDLKLQAAQLMVAKAPRAGKKILIERVSFIWKRISFSNKITLRNLFRYKGRLLMTLFGVAGCTSLIISGFTLYNAVSPVVDIQYSEIQDYDLAITFSSGRNEDDLSELKNVLNDDDRIKELLFVNQSTVSVNYNDINMRDVYLIIPEDNNELDSFIHLENEESGDKITLNDNGVVITQKAATLLGVNVGDTVTLTYDEKDYEVKILGISKNYIVHYIFMSKGLYEELTSQNLRFTTSFAKIDDPENNSEALAESLLENRNIIAVSIIQQIKESTQKSLSSMNGMIIMLIFSAGILAFIVLYNLTNINIQERKREIATIKVLGFKKGETNMYIFRENIIMMIMGIIIGIVPGYFMGTLMVNMCEADATLLYHHVNLYGYLYAIGLTILFNVVVNLIMLNKVKSVDMIESLKALE